MYLKQIELNQFRNISREKIDFSEHINIIHGRNGQGKTSILEAIFFLSITKSFRAKSEKIVLQHDKEYFQINGFFETDTKDDFSVRLYYSAEEGKHVFLNQNKVEKFSQFIGKIPITLLSLENLELTYGVPENRRKFIDILLSQISPVYLYALQAYKKTLNHRNRLLSLIAEKKENQQALFPWDEQLVKYGSDIIRFRNQFVKYANDKIDGYYSQLSLTDEQISVKYKTNIKSNPDDEKLDNIEEQLRAALSENINSDLFRQNTLSGPHRDDLIFYKDNYPLKSYGSQGENKTLIIALKLVESEYLKEKTNENPILIMDDIFGELDDQRIKNLLGYVVKFGQTFITTTSDQKFKEMSTGSVRFLEIERGMVAV